MIKKQEAKQYNKFILTSKDLLKDPVSQFDKWFNEAIAENISIPEAMTLSTADHEGKVSSRIVLLKDVIEEDFIFFSNYKSRKGQQLEQNQYASLLFFWPDFERQIRIEGLINKTDSSISDHYFHSRPYESQAAACISPQSEPIAERVELEQK
ncbi:MAG: pyridoxal 5'-phosphate synthase, partial [Bacteroidota bacterium]